MQPTLVTGEGVGGQFVAAAEEELAGALGFRPFPGTLNLEGASIEEFPAHTIDEVGDDYCDGVRLRDCCIAGVRAAVVKPFVPDYPPEKTEILAPVRLRSLFDFAEGDAIPLGPPDSLWPPAEQRTVPDALDQFDAVVFDLDGTLVDLATDWAAVRTEIESAVGDRLEGSIGEYDAPDLYRAAHKHGVYDDLVTILATHEREGAERATSRALLDALEDLSCPVGICTANDPDAADRALKQFGVRNAVDAIVGRDTVPEHKPAPEPLLTCLDNLDARPGDAVFVGDMRSDAETARRAGASFLASEQLTET